jgi:Ca2+-binding RTX toxin-like protein
MATINGTIGNDALTGNSQGVGDEIYGGRGNDALSGLSGDDYLSGGRGNDVLIGGSGSDVMAGGLDTDVFRFSAGHITQNAIDWIVDFNFNQGDTLDLLASATAGIEIVSATAAYVTNGSFGAHSLENSASGRELILEVRNTSNGSVQKVVLLDSYSNSNSVQWDTYLDSFGVNITINDTLGTITL